MLRVWVRVMPEVRAWLGFGLGFKPNPNPNPSYNPNPNPNPSHNANPDRNLSLGGFGLMNENFLNFRRCEKFNKTFINRPKKPYLPAFRHSTHSIRNWNYVRIMYNAHWMVLVPFCVDMRKVVVPAGWRIQFDQQRITCAFDCWDAWDSKQFKIHRSRRPRAK